MSYDISIGGESFNHTSNTSSIWYRHIPDLDERGMRCLHGMTGKMAAAHLADFFDNVHREMMNDWCSGDVGDSKFRARYDASNGWGSTVSVLVFTAQVMAACHRHPRSKVFVSY